MSHIIVLCTPEQKEDAMKFNKIRAGIIRRERYYHITPLVVSVDRDELSTIDRHNFDAKVIGICVFESPFQTHLSSIKHLITPKKDIEGRFHPYHNNKVGGALYSFMKEIGLLDLDPRMYVESYNDILSERVVSCFLAGDVTISLPHGKNTLKDGRPRVQRPQNMTWPGDFERRIQDAKGLISSLGKEPKVLLKADGKLLDLRSREYNLVIDMAYWNKTGGTSEEDWGATGPLVIKASMVWRMVMYQAIWAAIRNEGT